MNLSLILIIIDISLLTLAKPITTMHCAPAINGEVVDSVEVALWYKNYKTVGLWYQVTFDYTPTWDRCDADSVHAGFQKNKEELIFFFRIATFIAGVLYSSSEPLAYYVSCDGHFIAFHFQCISYAFLLSRICRLYFATANCKKNCKQMVQLLFSVELCYLILEALIVR